MPNANDPNTVLQPFLGQVEEICLVTADRERTARALSRLGIGPWRFMEIHPGNSSEQTYRGRAQPFSIRLGFAEVGGAVLELMQPMDEHSIFAEHLRRKGEGLHHVSFTLDGEPWDERIKAFEARGFPVVQSGLWMGAVRFAFFDTEAATGMSFETYHYPDDWTDPPGEVKWWPSAPV
ncbi:MAG: VOC family protein [Devosiaceae bacterium]|nr:VOC family protein [Devosiaceae bacterium MH13]